MSVNTIGSNPTGSKPTQTTTDQRSQGATASGSTSVQSSTAQNTSVSNSGDTVQLSSAAVDLQALESHINGLPDVDRARVTEIRNQISNGQYSINPSRIAEKIIGFDAELK